MNMFACTLFNEQDKRSNLLSIITWSVSGKQNVQANKVYWELWQNTLIITDPAGSSEFCFPSTLMFPSASPWESRGNKILFLGALKPLRKIQCKGLQFSNDLLRIFHLLFCFMELSGLTQTQRNVVHNSGSSPFCTTASLPKKNRFFFLAAAVVYLAFTIFKVLSVMWKGYWSR